MGWSLLADAVMLLHASFIAWVVLGGFAVARWPRLAWLHVPAMAWGVWIQWSGGICPLTPLEQRLRSAAGEPGYSGGFIEHYVGALIYPGWLTREWQWVLGAIVVAVNAVAYAIVMARHRRRRS